VRLTIIESGTVAPHPSRVCASHLVETGALRLLMDCGSGAVHRMASLGIGWPDITHVAITHRHFDHVGDLPALISALRWGQLPPRSEPLVVIGAPGIRDWLMTYSGVIGEWLVLPQTYTIEIVELAPEERITLEDGRVEIQAFPVSHTAESVAYSIRTPRARIVYTGDTPYDERLADWAAACDVLLTECSLPTHMAIEGHLTPELAGAFAARARPAQLVLAHFYPPVEREDIPSLVRTRWAGPLVLAHDGTTLDLED
jgi:ribonuclease BN (tRNA processing enzyme)